MTAILVNYSETGLEDISETILVEEEEVSTEDIVDLQNMQLTDNEINMALNDADYMWSADDHYPEEVMLEVEVVTWVDTEDNTGETDLLELENLSPTHYSGSEEEGTLIELRNMTPPHESGSDYGSETGTEHNSDMDLSHGSLDLSRTGPHYSNQSQHQSQNGYHDNLSQNSYENVSNSSTPEEQPDPVQPQGLDLSQGTRITASPPRSRAYMHYSGGNVELSPNSSGVLNPAFFQYQLPRIKLEPGLGIDPTITYKPEMDFNHNKAMTSSPQPGTAAISHIGHRQQPLLGQPINIYPRLKMEEHLPNGCDNNNRTPCDNMTSPRVGVETLPSNLNCIPLTVTSQDDDNDSGTESIDSKDSDASNNLCISENGTSKKQSSDKKRPGRKKGQVSKVYHLWEFIRDVLNDPDHSGRVIKWENEEEGIFRVVQSEVAATMWGQKKNNRTKMTYEKMSRSIRYSRKEGYFDDLPKDKGYPKKLCFKFGKKAHGWNNKRRQFPTSIPLTKLDP